ncbi:MAG: hypothetical protein ABH842_00920 [Candidatus Micrarchaeota archaeon]
MANRLVHTSDTRLNQSTAERLAKSVARIAEQTGSKRLESLSLSNQSTVALTGVQDLRLFFLGIDNGAMVYRNRNLDKILRPLKRISFGLRYDIYATDILTRDDVERYISAGKLDPSTVPGFFSSQHAFATVVFDKWSNEWLAPTWHSIGRNLDSLAPLWSGNTTAREQAPISATPFDSAAIVRSTDIPSAIAKQEPTRLRLGIPELMLRVESHLASVHHFTVINLSPISSNNPANLPIGNNLKCAASFSDGAVHLSWTSNGATNNRSVVVDTYDSKKSQSIGDGYDLYTWAISISSDQNTDARFLIVVGVFDDKKQPCARFVATAN